MKCTECYGNSENCNCFTIKKGDSVTLRTKNLEISNYSLSFKKIYKVKDTVLSWADKNCFYLFFENCDCNTYGSCTGHIFKNNNFPTQFKKVYP